MTTKPIDPGKFLVGSKPGQWLIESRSQPGTHHTLSNIGTGFETCTCKAFEIRGKCAHLTAILAELDPFLDNVPSKQQRGEPMSVPTRAVSVIDHEPPIHALAPAAALHSRLDDMGEQIKLVRQFVREQMVEGTDYGTIPGTSDRLNLLKPGAEKLIELYGYSFKLKTIDETSDIATGFYRALVVVSIHRRDDAADIGEGAGTCNSFESKYRWRNADRFCPRCGTDAIIKGRVEFGGGWICFKKKGGCGAKYDDYDTAITSQPVGRVENDDLFSTWNTVLKMAKKRALIDAALGTTRSSSLFTQDMGEEATEPEPPPPPPVAAKTPPVASRSAAPATKAPSAYDGALRSAPGWEEELREALKEAGLMSAALAIVLGQKPTYKAIADYMKGTGFSVQELVWEAVAKLEAQREASLPADIDDEPNFDQEAMA